MKNINDVKLKVNEFSQKFFSSLKLLRLDEKEKRLQSLKKELTDPQIYNDLKKSQKISQDIKMLENITIPWKKITQEYQDIETLIDMAEEDKEANLLDELIENYNQIEKEFNRQEILMMFQEKTDSYNAYLSVHPGAGGTESCDWANMIYRMYSRYAEQKNLTVSLIDYQGNEEAGIKSVTIHIKGSFAYGLLKGESGVHRLVRISPFDSNKKRHTSFCSVHVTAEVDDSIEIKINDSDIKIDTYRASGAGGQHVNTTDSAVRITHIPSNIIVTSQAQRSQLQNKATAMKILRSRLYEKIKQEKKKEAKASDKKKIEWGSQIRSYVFHPYYLVKDHRTSTESSNVNAVMDGELDLFINSYLKNRSQDEH